MKAYREDFEMLLKNFKGVEKDLKVDCFTVIDFKDYSDFIEDAKAYLKENDLASSWRFTTGWQTGFVRV